MNPRTALAAVGAVALLVGGLAGYLYGVSSTPPVTVTKADLASSLGVYDQVASAYANRLLLLGSDNGSALARAFESNASVTWRGGPGLEGCQLAGNYTGIANITVLMSIFAKYHQGGLLVSEESQTVYPEGPYWMVDSTFNFAGNNSLVGGFGGTVAAQDAYARVAGAWLVSTEVWNITNYHEQYPASSMNVSCQA